METRSEHRVHHTPTTSKLMQRTMDVKGLLAGLMLIGQVCGAPLQWENIQPVGLRYLLVFAVASSEATLCTGVHFYDSCAHECVYVCVCVFVTCRNGTASHGHMCMCVVARMSGVRLQSSGSSRSCVKYARDCLRRKRGAGCLTDPDLAHCLQPRGATLSCQRRDSFRARFALHVRRLPGRARGINGQP